MARPTSIKGPLRPLIDALGGVIKAADRMGVDRSTLRRWGTGATSPAQHDRDFVNGWADALGVKRPYKEAAKT